MLLHSTLGAVGCPPTLLKEHITETILDRSRRYDTLVKRLDHFVARKVGFEEDNEEDKLRQRSDLRIWLRMDEEERRDTATAYARYFVFSLYSTQAKESDFFFSRMKAQWDKVPPMQPLKRLEDHIGLFQTFLGPKCHGENKSGSSTLAPPWVDKGLVDPVIDLNVAPLAVTAHAGT